MLDFLNIEYLDNGDIALEVYRADLWSTGKPGYNALKKVDRSKMKAMEAQLVEKVKTFPVPARDPSSTLSIETAQKIFAYIKTLYEKAISMPDWKNFFAEVKRNLADSEKIYRKYQPDIEFGDHEFRFSLHFVKATKGEMRFRCGDNHLTQIWVLSFLYPIIEIVFKAFPNLHLSYDYDENYPKGGDILIWQPKSK